MALTKKFKIYSDYKPSGDQPKAILELTEGIKKGFDRQTLLGVTGSGKTFTIANLIEKTQMPTLVIAHNKTLAAQLCNEFREFFPENAVEYFVSYYDYYQPESYLPSSDTYIEKEAQINQEIDRLRHACTQALLTRRDVIVVASVSAIYNLGSPAEYLQKVFQLVRGQKFNRESLTRALIEMQYERMTADLKRGTFRLRGQVFEIMPMHEDLIYRLEVSEKIEQIEILDAVSRVVKENVEMVWIFPAKHYTASNDDRTRALEQIEKDLNERLKFFKSQGKILEEERLKRKTRYDLEMIKNIGYCNGVENYSRYFDGRKTGEAPFTLLDYFAHCGDQINERGEFSSATNNFLTVIDESHVSLPQIRGMFNGDRARKDTLIEHGFRLPSARDNRPLKFEEFEKKVDYGIFVSATPSEYEISNSKQIVEQIVRPTGLIDPELIIRPISTKKTGASKNNLTQVEDLLIRIDERVKKKERVLVTTLTKRMAEDLDDYLRARKIKTKYLHSDIDTIERIEIITALRKGEIDVIVGVNLLREGLDIPEVSLVAILDADKEGFLRNETSLIQTIGRAARNVNGQVVIYADEITGSISRAIKETDRRRKIQIAYNKKHGITPKTIEKNIRNILEEFGITPKSKNQADINRKQEILKLDLIGETKSLPEIIKEKEAQMRSAAKDLEFELATILRDEIIALTKQISKKRQ